jgi:glutathione S-transferase
MRFMHTAYQIYALDLHLEDPHPVVMKLYFNPMACSLASRIAVYEAGLPVDLIEVDPATKRLPDGSDYRKIHSPGLVPALALDDGVLLTENAAVLQYLGDRAPDGKLAPSGFARSQLHQWLCFVGTELHKGFVPLLDKKAPAEVKAYALGKLLPKLAYVEQYLTGRSTLLDQFSVADGYLFTVLNWTVVTSIKLADYPALAAFHARMLERPAVKRAFEEERQLFLAEVKRAI